METGGGLTSDEHVRRRGQSRRYESDSLGEGVLIPGRMPRERRADRSLDSENLQANKRLRVWESKNVVVSLLHNTSSVVHEPARE